jgi:hypothetical protein
MRDKLPPNCMLDSLKGRRYNGRSGKVLKGILIGGMKRPFIS